MSKLIMPIVCECGYSTMDAEKAREHAERHELTTIRMQYEKTIERNKARGLLTFICLDGWRNGGTPYNRHGEPFSATQEELDAAYGWFACEYCEQECKQL